MTYSKLESVDRELHEVASKVLKLLLLSNSVTVLLGIFEGTAVNDLLWQSTDDPLHVHSVGHALIASKYSAIIAIAKIMHRFGDILGVTNFTYS